MQRKLILATLTLVVLCLGSTLAAAERGVVYHGMDLWTTPADGRTAVSFAENPIPAGFFCSSSQPFTGTIRFQGVPLETSPAGVLGNTDTIVERLDDAVFDSRGVARTRVQLRALSLEGMEPLVTSCGSFHVTAGLDAEQPVTIMEIVRDGSIGGYFVAPIELNFKLTFWPVSPSIDFRSKAVREPASGRPERTYHPLQLVQYFRLSSNPRAGWTFEPGQDGVSHPDVVNVDLDGDGNPEVEFPGTSNIAVGWWDDGGVPSRDNVYLNAATTQEYQQLHDCHAITAPSYDRKGKGKQ